MICCADARISLVAPCRHPSRACVINELNSDSVKDTGAARQITRRRRGLGKPIYVLVTKWHRPHSGEMGYVELRPDIVTRRHRTLVGRRCEPPQSATATRWRRVSLADKKPKSVLPNACRFRVNH